MKKALIIEVITGEEFAKYSKISQNYSVVGFLQNEIDFQSLYRNNLGNKNISVYTNSENFKNSFSERGYKVSYLS